MNYTISELSSEGFVARVMDGGADHGYSNITLSDNTVITLPTRMMLLNVLLWKPYFKLGVPITAAQVVHVKAITSDAFARIASKQYAEIIELVDVPYMDIINCFWEVLNDVYRFVLEHMGPYQRSMSILSLARVQCHPEVKKLTSVYIDPKHGTKVGEIKLKQLASELIDVIGTRGIIENNVLIDFMETKSLKTNQIPQQILAYGCRSDIDDRMMRYIINESAMSGLRNVHDFAIESLAAKKSSYFNKEVIKNTQYFARVLRLNNLSLHRMYPGHCGSTVTIPITIPAKDVGQFVDKLCFADGEKLHITERNMHEFRDRRVSLISPLACRHPDGICEYCAGRGTAHPWAYMPQVHIGLFAATKVGKAVSQMVLSAKHLNKTSSLVLVLADCAKKWLYVSGNDIFLTEKVGNKIDNLSLRVPESALRYLSDLEHGVSMAESFSDITDMDFIDDKGNIDTIHVGADRFIPHFSPKFLKHLSKNIANIDLDDDDYHIIPLKGFNIKSPILRYVTVNDDMVAFTKEVKTMLNTSIADYTSITNALNDLVRILYSKTTINVFFVEVLLKAFLRKADGDTGSPIIDDPSNVCFGGMRYNIERSSVAAKLGHERLGSKDYFAEASTSVQAKDPCEFDRYFGF